MTRSRTCSHATSSAKDGSPTSTSTPTTAAFGEMRAFRHTYTDGRPENDFA